MDLSSIKNYVAKNMKNMQFVNLRNDSDQVYASDSGSKAGLSIEELRNNTDDNPKESDHDDIEVGTIKKKIMARMAAIQEVKGQSSVLKITVLSAPKGKDLIFVKKLLIAAFFCL